MTIGDDFAVEVAVNELREQVEALRADTSELVKGQTTILAALASIIERQVADSPYGILHDGGEKRRAGSGPGVIRKREE